MFNGSDEARFYGKNERELGLVLRDMIHARTFAVTQGKPSVILAWEYPKNQGLTSGEILKKTPGLVASLNAEAVAYYNRPSDPAGRPFTEEHRRSAEARRARIIQHEGRQSGFEPVSTPTPSTPLARNQQPQPPWPYTTPAQPQRTGPSAVYSSSAPTSAYSSQPATRSAPQQQQVNTGPSGAQQFQTIAQGIGTILNPLAQAFSQSVAGQQQPQQPYYPQPSSAKSNTPIIVGGLLAAGVIVIGFLLLR